MRSSDVDILIVPGYAGNDADHWQSRWARHFKTAREVVQADWMHPDRATWVARIAEAVGGATRPAMLVGHSLGATAIVHAAAALDPARVAGAFLVAAPDFDNTAAWPMPDAGAWPDLNSFAPVPMSPLPFPTRMIASSDDLFCSIERSKTIAAAWGADLSIIAKGGHINTRSGHGPWPEGLLTFGQFLSGLGGPRSVNGAA